MTPTNSPLRGRMPPHNLQQSLVLLVSLPLKGKGWGWGHQDLANNTTPKQLHYFQINT